MIIAQQPLQVSREAGSSSLVVWLCDPFDREFSFRARLAEIEKTLGAVVELPPEEVGEDFVEGRLIWANEGILPIFRTLARLCPILLAFERRRWSVT